tara:strand:+ start:1248 stop:1772 length:525 start_codon:yes stop_codon:yes gene_type:complete
MGYTHYWYAKAKRKLPNWEQFTDKVNRIVGNDGAGVLPSALQKAEVTDVLVWIEGNPPNESFVFERVPENKPWRENEPWVFNYCKTARKPYDKYVTAILIAALDQWGPHGIFGNINRVRPELKVRSDGEIHEWEGGIKHYIDVFYCQPNHNGQTIEQWQKKIEQMLEKSFNKDD